MGKVVTVGVMEDDESIGGEELGSSIVGIIWYTLFFYFDYYSG